MKRLIAASFAAALLLTGCFIPEDFRATLEVKSDGHYTYHFEGVAVFGPALMTMENGKLPPADDAALRKQFATQSKQKSIRRMVYKGNGRVDIDAFEEHQLGQRIEGLGMVSVTQDKEGVITVKAAAPSARDRKMLAGSGVNVRGTVTVKLPSNAKVIASNADSASIFGTAYTWKVQGVDKTPQIRFKLTN